MTYLKRSNPTAKKNWAVAGAIVSLLLVVFMIHYAFPTFYGRLFTPIAELAWKSDSSLGGWLGYMAEMARSKSSLVDENESLKQEVALRDASVLLVSDLQSENEELKGLLDRKAAAKSADVLGVVLSRPPVSPYDSLIIDVGADHGLAVSDKVYADGSILIGDIAEVYGGAAKVSLYSTPGRATQVLVGPRHIDAQATGKGGGNFAVELPVEAQIAVGDDVLIPQIRDHVFGVVEKIDADSTDSIQTILFKAPVTISELRFVEVEVKK